MKANRVALACLIAWALQSGVSFAEADWWDKLSGPGPFMGVFATYRVACLKNPSGHQVQVQRLSPTDRTASFLAAFKKGSSYSSVVARNASEETARQTDCRTDQPVRAYLFFTPRFAWTLRNKLVSTEREGDRRVFISGVDFGYVDRLNKSFDISLSVGENHFWGAAFNSFDRPSVTTLIEYSPLGNALNNEKAHLIKFVVGGTMWFKEFKAEQFCNKPVARCVDPTWRSGPEFVPRIGFIYDWSVNR